MKKNLRKESGITLLTLGITIVILILITSMAVYSVNKAIESSRLTAFTTELKIMQAQVDLLNQKMKNNESATINGTGYKGEEIKNVGEDINKKELQYQASIALNEVGVSDNEEKAKYKYYNEELIKNGLGVEGVKQEVLINVESKQVVSYKGIEINGKTYYNLASLPGAMYNVEHETTKNKPDFDVAINQTSGEGKWNVKVSNIEYDGYVNKWQVKYKQEGQDAWKTSEDYDFEIDKRGTYILKIVNGDIESEEIKCTAEFKTMPDLIDGMQPVTITEDGTFQKANSTSDQWYSYEVTEDDDMKDGGTTNGGKSKWANVELNGNYYVWIPRYAYKIDENTTYENSNGTTSNKVEVQLIETSITNGNVEKEIGEGYKVPDAFTTEEKEISGIWVGKYELSGTLEELKVVPNAESLKDVNEEELSKKAKNLETDEISVFVTNEIEFEAIENFAKSQYGRNGTEIAKEDAEVENEDLKTTTGNKYGIYKLYENGYRITLLRKEN